jgi:hypothetical protein
MLTILMQSCMVTKYQHLQIISLPSISLHFNQKKSPFLTITVLAIERTIGHTFQITDFIFMEESEKMKNQLMSSFGHLILKMETGLLWICHRKI